MAKFLEALRISAEQARLEMTRSGLFEHTGDRSEYRERIIQEFLRPYLPECYGLGRGEVFSANGESSRQIDIVIYDAIFSSVLMKNETNQLFPCESVFGSIEVKTELKRETLEQGVQNIASLKILDREPSNMLDILPFRRFDVDDKTLTYGKAKRNPYLGVIFGYKGVDARRVVEYLEAQSNDSEKRMLLPDFVFNLERRYVVMRCETVNERKLARFFGNWDGYGEMDLGEYTLPIFYLTVNALLNWSILKAPDWGQYWLKTIEIASQSL